MTSKPAPAKTSQEFPIVGVGASAGGIDSFKRFLGAIPEKSGMAFVLVQHLSPSHDSILPEILARTTSLPVEKITDDHKLKPDHIYVIPENKLLEVTDHALRLTPRKEDGPNMPIDVFFSSLGKIHGRFATGIVLSGTARDGTIGLRDIKEHSGITLAEDPESAEWDGMPKSAIEANVVDFVMWPEEMPKKLLKVYDSYRADDSSDAERETNVDKDGIKKIYAVMRQLSGVDFSYYKKPTMLRRIDRRMAINQINRHEDYLQYLKENKSEQESLFQDLLIKVTSFFRDPEIFEELKESIFPELLKDCSDENPLRIWVAGCSTGEEVYSLAITLFEIMNGYQSGNSARIQIFASDVSETAIAKARTGVYGESELQTVSEERLNRYFSRTDGSYKVIKSIRDSIVFTAHNFLKDPPFGKVDLISCRNVFIYLEPFLQKKALSTFHYALKDSRYLLMGKSESIGKPIDLFAPHSTNGKIFIRKAGTGRFVPASTVRKPYKIAPIGKTEPSPREAKTDFKKSAEKVLISNFTPASVIVDEHSEIVHYNGNTEPFLVPSMGKPTHELLKMARKELAFELRNALHKASSNQERVKKEGIPVETENERFSVDIEIIPLTDVIDPHYLVLFWKRFSNISFLEKVWRKLEPSFSSSSQVQVEQRNKALENELEQLREDMHSISENQEAFNEELQSANEELLSSNEEMQSLNEELETSKEELESTNEELVVVNRELIEKQEELNDEVSYSDDVIASVREPFLVLDTAFRIQKANASYFDKFNTNDKEIYGKHFYEIHDGLYNIERLRALLEKVLPKKQSIVNEEIMVSGYNSEDSIFNFNGREIVREKESKKLILLEIADITQKKAVELDYINTIEELNRTNQQLDQFVHVASHDLQEPLRKISTFVSRITEKSDTISEEKKKVYLGKISASSSRMTALVKNMLNYARIANHEQLFEQIHINTVLEDILEDFELLIEQKEVELRISELPTIEAIPLHINQLFYNLISNALKFARKGVTPILSITSHKFSAEEIKKHPILNPELSYCEIIVRDNGIGFSPKYKEQIFTIFQRLNPSSQYLGTGIGLALCKKIAENHQGEIFANSKEGEGSSFHIILPKKQMRD